MEREDEKVVGAGGWGGVDMEGQEGKETGSQRIREGRTIQIIEKERGVDEET